MPATRKRKPKIDADDFYVAKTGVSWSQTEFVRPGERLPGSDPRVQKHPEYFSPDGTPIPVVPDYERPGPRIRRPKYDVLAHEHIEPLDAVILRRPLRVARAQDDQVVTYLPRRTTRLSCRIPRVPRGRPGGHAHGLDDSLDGRSRV